MAKGEKLATGVWGKIKYFGVSIWNVCSPRRDDAFFNGVNMARGQQPDYTWLTGKYR